MSHAATADSIFRKLSAELDRAVEFTQDSLVDYSGQIPASLLVIFKQRYKVEPFPFPLHDPRHIEISVMVDLRARIREAASQVANMEGAEPAYVLSMLGISSGEQSFWLDKGFFPKTEVPASFIDKDWVLLTAASASGQVLRRLSPLVSSPLLLAAGSRQLGRSVQVQLDNEPCEMDVFWSKLKAVRKQLSAQKARDSFL